MGEKGAARKPATKFAHLRKKMQREQAAERQQGKERISTYRPLRHRRQNGKAHPLISVGWFYPVTFP